MAFSLLDQLHRADAPLTVAQAAKMRGVTRQTIYNAINDGKIPTINDGIGAVRIDPHTWEFVLRSKNPLMRAAARG